MGTSPISMAIMRYPTLIHIKHLHVDCGWIPISLPHNGHICMIHVLSNKE